MKRNLIGLALVAGMAMANSAMAQDYDDRWYLTAGGGIGVFDDSRNVDNELYGTLGFGKFISPNFALDLELWHSNPKLDYNFSEDRNWELMSLSLVGRYYFGEFGESNNWRPYVALGIGQQEHHDGTQIQPLALGFNKSRTGSNMLGIAGIGMQGGLGRGSLRGEIGARFDMDDEGLDGGKYTDTYAGLTYVLPLGSRDEPVAVVVAAPQKTCADLDDDSDGVNNCNDTCAGTMAGQGVGADGCAIVVVQPQPEPQPEPAMAPKPFRN